MSEYRSPAENGSSDGSHSERIAEDADDERDDGDGFGDDFDDFEEGQEADDAEFGDFDVGFVAEGMDDGASSQPPVTSSSQIPIVSNYILIVFGRHVLF